MNRRLALIVALLVPSLNSHAAERQSRPLAALGATSIVDTLIPSSALLADVAVLRRALETVHPGLHRYNTPKQIDSIFSNLQRRFGSAQRTSTAYLAFSETMAALKCGHTFLNPVNQSRAVADMVFRTTPRVPFYFRWIDGAMIVTRDASSERAFPIGTKVEAINGVSTQRILATLLPYARADGSNMPKRVTNLELYPAERFQLFDVYYPMVFPSTDTVWTFRVRSRDTGVSSTVSARPATVVERMALYDSLKAARGDTAPPWTLAFDANGVATLRMPTWVTYNDKWDWQGYVNRAFDTLVARRTPSLIIDLRGNEGGTSVGDVILSRLVKSDVVLQQFQRYTRYRSLPDTSLRKYLDTWDRSFDDWKAQAQPTTNRPGFYSLVYDEDSASHGKGTPVRATAPRYTGKVVVLVGAENSSATFEFALAARSLGVATLVGQTTGGNQRGINGGAFYFLRLPNTRFEIDLPIVAFFPPGKQPDGGLIPDVLVRERWTDVGEGRDRTMQAALTLVRR